MRLPIGLCAVSMTLALPMFAQGRAVRDIAAADLRWVADTLPSEDPLPLRRRAPRLPPSTPTTPCPHQRQVGRTRYRPG